MDHNSQEYWDKQHKSEGFGTWRKYPYGFMLIRKTFQRSARIVELGCGMGVLLRQLQADGHVISGLDISKHATTKLQRSGYKARHFDATKDMSRLPAELYDAVIATEFFEHFDDETLDYMLTHCKRIAPILVGIVPDQMLPPEEFPEHKQCFSKETLHALLSKYYDNVMVDQFTEKFEKSATVGIKLNCLYFLAQNTGDQK